MNRIPVTGGAGFIGRKIVGCSRIDAQGTIILLEGAAKTGK